MRKIFLLFLCIFLIIPKVNAAGVIGGFYVGDKAIQADYNLSTSSTSINGNALDLGVNDPWLYNVGFYEYAGNVSGNYLYANADYLFALSYYDVTYNDFYGDSRFTLTQSNLRCGLGSAYKSGYDSTYQPEITNFSVERYKNTGFGNIVVYRIKFNYKQQIKTLNNVSKNISCWFERPSNGLIGQFGGSSELIKSTVRFAYKYNSISYSVSTDSSLGDINNSIGDINDSINNSDSSGATGSAGGFFEDFTTDTFGLTSVITAPLNFIKSLTSSSCTSLSVPLPFVDTNLTLPCMSTIYNQYFGGFYTLYQTITTGLIAYWVCVRIFNLVKDFKNPDHDEIEVMDL